MESLASSRLATLGHPARLRVFRLLMRRFPDRVPASELARALDLKANTLSTYIGALRQAGLVTQTRVGTSLRYAIDMDAARETLDYLFTDCCRGRADICPPSLSSTPENGDAMTDRKYNVLFLCSGNSARSIFAEAILRKEAGDRFAAYSAGVKPRSELNPFALELLTYRGHDVSPLRAKNMAEFQRDDAPAFDFVFTVCDLAANEDCPAWSGQPVSGHWSIQDPVKAEGTTAEKNLAFQQAYGALHNRIASFIALPFDSLDRIALQTAVDDIAKAHSGDPA